MEYQITFSQFVVYFGKWYPLLLPATFVTLCILAGLLDWLRVCSIRYVDDGDNAPYKKYVTPFLAGWLLKELPPVATRGADYDVPEYGVRVDKYWRYLAYDTKEDADRALAFMEKYGVDELYYYSVPHRGRREPDLSGRAYGNVAKAALYIFGSATAYKFVPALTVGALVGYGVLRMARTTVRLGKKLKAHIADPNAHTKAAKPDAPSRMTDETSP